MEAVLSTLVRAEELESRVKDGERLCSALTGSLVRQVDLCSARLARLGRLRRPLEMGWRGEGPADALGGVLAAA